MIHELAHNWDKIDETPGIKAFFDMSVWCMRRNEWTYHPDADFARDYGKTNPCEDFATSLEVYFLPGKPASQWQAKWTYMDWFLNSMSG